MAELIVNPPAELERRASDVPVPDERFLKFSLFARLAKKPTLAKFPGTLAVRRFRRGDIVCRQGESGWTAFYILTTEDTLALAREQLQAAGTNGERAALQKEIAVLEQRLHQASAGTANHSLRIAATVHLAVARPTPSGGGLLARLARTVLGRPARTPDRRPVYIPLDAPTGVSYDSRQAPLYEGDLFGEQSCFYGTPRSATIVVERDCYMIEMLRNILDQVQGDKAYHAEIDAIYKTRVLKNHLRNLSIISDLTEEQFALIRDIVELIRCKDGQLIYDEHDRSDGMYVIRGGLVKVMKNVSSLLAAEDVLNWPALTELVCGISGEPSAALRHIRQLLPEKLRTPAAEGSDSPPPAYQAELMAALNEVIKDGQLPDAPPMRELSASPAVAEFARALPAKRGDWSELDRRRYNRLLLEAAYPAGTLRHCQRSGGPETVLAYLGRGEFIGEMGLMAHQPRTATCIAYVHPRPDLGGPPADKWRRETEHVELVRIPEKAFWRLIEAAPAIRTKVNQVIDERRRHGAQRIAGPVWDESTGVMLSGRAEKLGLIQGQKLMLIDLDRCTRCDECVQACVNTHADGRSRLFLDGPRFDKYLVPTTCRACLDPVCMIGCPVGSIHRGNNRQIVIEDWCIGCELCARNCPYGSIQMHDVGIIRGSTHGWLYAPAQLAGAGWQRPRYSAAHWLPGKTPFVYDRTFQDGLRGLRTEAAGEALCFRYAFRMKAHLLRTAVRFKLEVVSADDNATVWLNGREIPKPAEKPRGGKREYLLTRAMNLLRRGRNVLAVQVVPVPPSPGKKAPLLELRLDEVREPAVAPKQGEPAEVVEKVVTDVAVVCDMCSGQFGQRPACVTACPHDAAMRVDARFNFPSL
jgi:Fe-S-cluster-containing hydrogenase component 2/CRP-like cAMP-binding protein